MPKTKKGYVHFVGSVRDSGLSFAFQIQEKGALDLVNSAVLWEFALCGSFS